MMTFCVRKVASKPLLKKILNRCPSPTHRHISEVFFTYFEIWTKIQHKDKDSYKDNDKEKDAKRITETITVCYTFRILTTQAFQTMSNNEQ